MKRHRFRQRFLGRHKPRHQQGGSEGVIFSGNNENFIKNGGLLLKERISLFDGRTNSIRCFSLDYLNAMNVYQNDQEISGLGRRGSYANNACVWDGKSVMVKIFMDRKVACPEIAVATQMGTHSNVHRLVGYCLNTENPAPVYELADDGTLYDRIYCCEEQSKEPLEWKARLRIAWEIAHAVAYLHTAFRQPIVHRDLKPFNVFLELDDSARLSDFSCRVSIPKGKKHAEDDMVIGTVGFMAPDYMISGKAAESSDVFAFGVLLLVLLTGKFTVFDREMGSSSPSSELSPESPDCVSDTSSRVSECRAGNCLDDIADPVITKNGTVAESPDCVSESPDWSTDYGSGTSSHRRVKLVDWASECRAGNCLDDIVDPAITKNGMVADEHFEHQLKALVELSLRYTSEEEECRPNMVDVATELKSMIMSSSDSI